MFLKICSLLTRSGQISEHTCIFASNGGYCLFVLAGKFLSSSAASSFRKSREGKRRQFSLGSASKSASESIHRQKEAEQVSFPNLS